VLLGAIGMWMWQPHAVLRCHVRESLPIQLRVQTNVWSTASIRRGRGQDRNLISRPQTTQLHAYSMCFGHIGRIAFDVWDRRVARASNPLPQHDRAAIPLDLISKRLLAEQFSWKGTWVRSRCKSEYPAFCSAEAQIDLLNSRYRC
jgi:hypothetical protein